MCCIRVVHTDFAKLTVQENVHGLRLFTKVLDNDAGAGNNLTGVTLTVDLAETGPLTELLSIGDLDQVDVVLSAKSLDKLDVLLLSAGLNKDSKMSLTSGGGFRVSIRMIRPSTLTKSYFFLPVESLGSLTETTGKTVVDQGATENFLESLLNGHLSLGGISSDLDFLGINSHMFFLGRHFSDATWKKNGIVNFWNSSFLPFRYQEYQCPQITFTAFIDPSDA